METATLKKFFEELSLSDNFFSELKSFVGAGSNKLLQLRTAETISVDDSWITTIEKLIYSVEQIVKNPKKFIKDKEVLLNVEKARKVSAVTIRHLASHTNFIRAIDENGKIQPSKVLTSEMQEDLLIYENRFVFALIQKLIAFIEKRYETIKSHVDSYETTNLVMKSKFKIGGGDVEYDTNLKVRQPGNKAVYKRNHEQLKKIEIIRKRLLILRNTNFCKALSAAKPVAPPIIKTNIINMQTDYNNCYKLWLFISTYTAMGYTVEISQKKLPIDTEYYDDLTMLVALGLKSMVENNALRHELYSKVPTKRRRIKKFSELPMIEYSPNLRSKGRLKDSELVNQYYYDKLKELIIEKQRIKESDIVVEETMKVSFQKFFRGINKLTNEMYEELLAVQKPELPMALDPKTRLTQEIKAQEEICKKLKLLNRLKATELLQALKRENTQKLKLERLRFKEQTLIARANKKRITKDNITAKENIEETKALQSVVDRAQADERERRAKELERQKKILEKHNKKRNRRGAK